MQCIISDVSERDMDLLFLEEFACSDAFLRIFLDKIQLENAVVLILEHSKTDVEYGESDITVILQSGDQKIALLIEDKIDAIAMQNQCERYFHRGNRGIENGEYDAFYIFMIAPQKYLTENAEAQKYPYRVSYEECIAYFENYKDKRSEFKLCQIRSAVQKQKSGYQVIESQRATRFWNQYLALQKAKYPDLYITNASGAKGARMKWVYFATPVAKAYLIHKIEAGCVDLEFSGYADRIPALTQYITSVIGNLNENGVGVFKTGKSAVLRMQVPALNFDVDFEKDIDKINCCLQAVVKLKDITLQLSEHALRKM